MRALLLAAALLSLNASAFAKDSDPNPIQGLWLATDYPALQIRAGEDTAADDLQLRSATTTNGAEHC